MSPAGYWPQLEAAIEAGADSVYFGLKHFTARAKVGFSISELPEVMRTLHRRGVKGFVTFNTLVFDHELSEAAHAIAAIAEAGADALIVQDVGITRLIRRIAPALEIHGSTQMSVTSAAGVRLAESFGVSRVVLARELSLEEIRRIRQATSCELEVFVHGALCVAYSGQCFSSEAWGGRSANRGQCAQACRLPYELIVDGRHQPLEDARYLLSPGDLYALHQIPELVEIGVSALKIEGRYKDADYVALATAAYRKAVDEAAAGRPLSVTPKEELDLAQVYSRGLGPYFVTGTDHQRVVRGRAPRHRGVEMGTVTRLSAGTIQIRVGPRHHLSPLKPGDGVVFDSAGWRSPEEPEEGGRVYHVSRPAPDIVELSFGNRAIDFARIRPGDVVWRTHDPDLDRSVRVYTEAAAPVTRQPVRVRVTAREGSPLEVEWALLQDPAVQVRIASPEPLPPARSRGLSAELLREQFSRLGNTPYRLEELVHEIVGAPFAPASLLNDLRRQAVEALQSHQTAPAAAELHDPDRALAALLCRPAHTASAADAHLHLLVRTPVQLEAAIPLRPATITLDYLDLYGLRPSVERVKAAGISVRVASPRILKPGEERIADFLRRLECSVLVRGAGLVEDLRGGPELIGDFSLNAANVLTAETFLGLGLTRITPTHDLNAAQVAELARRIGPDCVEAIAYQHLPVFHTEHCVFCRFLSTGTSYKDCGRPCEKHRVAVRDREGREHPVMADVGCRNTVFGAEAQEASGHLADWRKAGIRHFRLEFAHESGAELTRVVRAFEDALAGRATGEELAGRLRKAAPQGTTPGSLFVPSDYLQLPVLQ